MKTINPKCTNEDSFKYSVIISLHYYELNKHQEKINQLNKYLTIYNFKWNNYSEFENNNPNTSLTVCNELNEIIYEPKNKSNNRANIIKTNNRYHALNPSIDKFMQLKQFSKQFTYKELTEYSLNNIIQS